MMGAETGNRKVMSIKLLVDKKNNIVVFAEAGKEFVDFIFHILALPIATLTRLLTKTAMVGSLGNLYGSFQTLERSYLEISKKNTLLKPKTPIYGGGSCEALLLPPNSADRKVDILEGAGGGYVKGELTYYLVMDNLVVKPAVPTVSSTIHLLNQLNVKDLSFLEEKTVEFGFDQAVQLLESSLNSTTVLTDVFLTELLSLRSARRQNVEQEEEEEEAEEVDVVKERIQVVEESAQDKKKTKRNIKSKTGKRKGGNKKTVL